MCNRMILNETAYFGQGAIEHIAPEIKRRGYNKVAVITDKGLMKVQVATKVIDLLQAAGIKYEVFDGIEQNPTIQNVKDGVQFVEKVGAEAIVVVGGGSPIDAAKAIAIITTNPEFADVISLEGVADTKRPCMPILAVPTTSGTAAETTINYVITDEHNHRKFVCADPHDIPLVAFVDSDMMMGMPASLCAATGMDAMTHALEGYITKGAWAMTDMLHIKAIEMIGSSLRASVAGDPKAREQMALAQYIAGMGFSNVGLGLAHGMAHPLSARYNIPHGVACAVLLPTVMKYNKDYTDNKYRDIAIALKVAGAEIMELEQVRDAACAAIEQLSKDVGIPATISELGVKAEDIPATAEDAFRDVCTPGNPRKATLQDIIELYQSLM